MPPAPSTTEPADQPAAPSSPASFPWRPYLQTLAIFLAVRILFLALRPPTAVSTDAYAWVDVYRLLTLGINPYATTTVLNWPPLWLGCINLIGLTAAALHVSFLTVLFPFLILIESLTLAATFALLNRLCPFPSPNAQLTTGSSYAQLRRLPLRALALSPAAIFQTTQHGNFDVLLSLFILLSLLALTAYLQSPTSTKRGRGVSPLHPRPQPPDANNPRPARALAAHSNWLLSATFLGMAILTKTVPIILLPLLLFPPRNPAARPSPATYLKLLGLLLALAPAAISLALLYHAAPTQVLHNVLLYHSLPACNGITGLLQLAHLPALANLYATVFPIALLLVLIAAALHLRTCPLPAPRSAILAAALALLALPTLGPGYAPQYIYWYLPLFTIAYAAYPNPGYQKLLRRAFTILTLTYLLEYFFLPSHGALAITLSNYHNTFIYWLTDHLSPPTAQTLLRLPLWLASLAVLYQGAQLLQTESKKAPGTHPGLPPL